MPVQVQGSILSIGDVRYRLGRAGDRLAVGDWSCDGRVTAALVRPQTGEVFVFPDWARRGHAVTVTPIAVVAGARGPVDPTPDRCGPLQVQTAAGPVAVPTSARTRP